MATVDLVNQYRDRLAPTRPMTAPVPPRNASLTIKSVFAESWLTLKSNLGYFLLLCLTVTLANFIPNYLAELLGGSDLLVVIINVLGYLLKTLVSFGLIVAILSLALGRKLPLGSVFMPNLRLLLYYLLASLLLGIALIPAFILLLVPGVYLSVRTQFYPMLIAHKGLGPVAALKESWRLTQGKFWFLLLFALIGILISFLSTALFIGIIFLTPVLLLLQSTIYKHL